MFTKKQQGKIIFYYAHADLFDDVQHLSAYMCKNIANKEGDDLSEKYAITDDEEPVFGVCLRETLPNVYEAVKPLTHGLEDAITDSMSGTDLATLTGETVTADETYAVIVTHDHMGYNPNDVKIADSALQTAIEQGVIAEYYARVMAADLTDMSLKMSAATLESLEKRLLPLRRRSVVH